MFQNEEEEEKNTLNECKGHEKMLTFSTIIFVSNVQWNFLIDMIPKNLIPSMNHILKTKITNQSLMKSKFIDEYKI